MRLSPKGLPPSSEIPDPLGDPALELSEAATEAENSMCRIHRFP